MSAVALSDAEWERAEVLVAQTSEWAVDLFHGDKKLSFVVSAPDWCDAYAQCIKSAGLCHEPARRVIFDCREI